MGKKASIAQRNRAVFSPAFTRLNESRLLLSTLFAVILSVTAIMVSGIGRKAAASSNHEVAPNFVIDLPAAPCAEGSSDTNCHYASPALADIDGDGHDDIIIATNSAHIVVVDHIGNIVWDTDLAPYFALEPDAQRLRSSPAIGDIDADGHPEIVIATSSFNGDPVCRPGGVVAISHTGQLEDGWPKLAEPDSDGCPYGYFATPTLGDLDLDGDLEIVIGGFDKQLHAWHHDGTELPNFPLDSYHYLRFPTWHQFNGHLGDTIWSSPAIADLNDDGYPEIIVGTDEGNLDERWGGDADGWTCPYELPPGWMPGSCGGSVYVIDRFGNHLPGFPKYVLETVQSSPAVSDLNGDGVPEIVIGTGSFYYNNSPDHPTDSFRVYAWDVTGNDLPGWEDGKLTSSPTITSPAIGNITGDSLHEVVLVDQDGLLYAWHADGSIVSGFPMTPLTDSSYTHGVDLGKSIVLADYDGDAAMEIFYSMNGSVTIIDGDGTQLTASDGWQSTLPAYSMEGSMPNNPAVGDLNHDGVPELIANFSELHVWSLDGASISAEWPMFRRDAVRSGTKPTMPIPVFSVNAVTILHQSGDDRNPQTSITMQLTEPMHVDWDVDTDSARVTVTPVTGALNTDQVVFDIQVDVEGLADGRHELGFITFDVGVSEEPGDIPSNSTTMLPVLTVIGDIMTCSMPLVTR